MNDRLSQIDDELAAVEHRATATQEQLQRDRAHFGKLLQRRPVRKALCNFSFQLVGSSRGR